MRRSIIAICLGLLLAWAAGSAWANDPSAELAAGGLVVAKTSSIAMQREDLTLSPSEVRIRYEMRNDTSRPVTLRVAFPMPEIPKTPPTGLTTAGASNIIMPRVTGPNFLGLRVWADGQEIAPEVEIHASLPDGRDISDAVRQIGGLPLLLRARDLERETKPGAAGQDGGLDLDALTRRRLEALGALEQDDEVYDLKWTTRITFHWMQIFRPGVTVLEQSYRPIIGNHMFEVGPDAPVDRLEKQRYCIDPATERTIRSLSRRGDLRAFTLGYVLQTARNWRGPIGTFHFTLQGDTVSTAGDTASRIRVMSLCTDLLMHQVGPTRFEATMHDYVPAYDLLVLMLAD